MTDWAYSTTECAHSMTDWAYSTTGWAYSMTEGAYSTTECTHSMTGWQEINLKSLAYKTPLQRQGWVY